MSAPRKKVEFLCAVLLVSRNHHRLARWYRDVLGVPLEDEQHGGSEKHYGCELGDIHFAIHPVANFPDRKVGTGAVKLALEVFDLDDFSRRMTKSGVKLLYPPKEVGGGFMRITALRDPDGNYLEFTQLGEGWYRHLEKRRKSGHDIVKRWKAHHSTRVRPARRKRERVSPG